MTLEMFDLHIRSATVNPISEYLLIPAVWVGGVESTPPAKNPLKSFWSHFFQVYI